MFRNVIESQWGTGRGIGTDRPLAGKTGTSQNYNDSWFVCFSPEFVLVIRVGFDQPKPMINPRTRQGLTGGGGALKIAKIFLQKVGDKLHKPEFPVPQNIELRSFDPITGKEPTEGGQKITAAFKTK
jgi:penicillin-binding protein 1A